MPSPLLYLLFIEDIAREFPPDVEVTLFADDLAVFATEKTVALVEENAQAALNELRKWAEKCKMDVSVETTVATIFTLDPHEARQEARLFMGDARLRHEPTPTFLGVRFDRTLSFRQHWKGHQGQEGEEVQRSSSRQREGLGPTPAT